MRRLDMIMASLAVAGCTGLEPDATVSRPSDDLAAEGYEIVGKTGISTKTGLDDRLKVVWDAGDAIKVMSADNLTGAVYCITELSSDGTAAIFAPEAPDDAVAGVPRYAVYPASASGRTIVGDSPVAEVDFSALDASGLVYGYAEDTVLPEDADVSGVPMVACAEGNIFDFKSLCGAVQIRPYDYQTTGIELAAIRIGAADGSALGGTATVDMREGRITAMTGDKTHLQYVLDNPVSIETGGWTSWSVNSASTFGSDARCFLVWLPAMDYAEGLEVTLVDSDGMEYGFVTDPLTVRPAAVTRLPYMPLTVYYGTANCVRAEPGTTSVRVEVTPYCSFSGSFEPDGIPVKGASGAIAGVSVVWQQEHGCPETDLSSSSGRGTVIPAGASIPVSEEDGHTYIDVPLTGTAGNAVIAIKDSDGTVLWSFHIWVGEVEDVGCSNPDGGDYVLMDRNLGATSVLDRSQCTEETIRNSFGLFYQWGRKDPFPRVLSRSARVTSYRAENAFTNSVTRDDRTIGNIGYTVRNPEKRIWLDNGSGCNWLMSYINELWGFPYSATDPDRIVAENMTVSGVKTVYDPCPEGYRIADLKHLYGLLSLNGSTLSGRDTYYGYYFRTGDGDSEVFFPAAGYVSSRFEDATALCYETYWGLYWTSASGLSNTHLFRIDGQQYAQIGNDLRGQMLSVRCLKMTE